MELAVEPIRHIANEASSYMSMTNPVEIVEIGCELAQLIQFPSLLQSQTT